MSGNGRLGEPRIGFVSPKKAYDQYTDEYYARGRTRGPYNSTHPVCTECFARTRVIASPATGHRCATPLIDIDHRLRGRERADLAIRRPDDRRAGSRVDRSNCQSVPLVKKKGPTVHAPRSRNRGGKFAIASSRRHRRVGCSDCQQHIDAPTGPLKAYALMAAGSIEKLDRFAAAVGHAPQDARLEARRRRQAPKRVSMPKRECFSNLSSAGPIAEPSYMSTIHEHASPWVGDGARYRTEGCSSRRDHPPTAPFHEFFLRIARGSYRIGPVNLRVGTAHKLTQRMPDTSPAIERKRVRTTNQF